ncbi:MAG: hypothetical protein Q8P90_02290 [bacterium]|nr:hypothetical protein [bacterium]
MISPGWVILGLISTIAFSFINLADRKFLNELNAHPIAYPAFATTLGTIITGIFAIFLLEGIDSFNITTIKWGLLSGVISLIGSSLFYFCCTNI